MKFSLSPSWVLVALFAAASPSFAAVPLSAVNKADTGRYVPNEYIVEMASVSALGGKRAYSPLSVHEEVYNHMRKRGIEFDVKTEYDTPSILVGASMKIESPEDVAKIVDIPGVQTVRPILIVPGPAPVESYTATDPNDPKLPTPMSTHYMTGVEKLHAAGITGEGIKIGIIDSGIDWKHPSLGGGLGEGFKVIGGWDFVGDDYTGRNTPKPDNDPMDCGGHGTHVAGIISSDPGNDFGVVGNAYKASIAAYRVFGCGGSTTDEIIAQSLIRGYNEGMDILTLSLGGVDGWTQGTGSVVASRIAEQGRVVTIAAGNDGSDGAWYTSSPGNGISAISVGSVDNTVMSVQNLNVKGVEHAPISYIQALPLKTTGEFPLYVTNKDTTVKDDACTALPADTPDLTNHVVLIHRGTCTFQSKVDNVAKFGAKLFVIYNSDDGQLTGVSVDGYEAVMISAEAGKFLVEQFAAGAEIKLEFPVNGSASTIEAPNGGLTSSFSSYGPTYDMFMKPAVAAPGGNILSTVPTAQGSWGVKSGTSMATPFAAGAAALVLQAKGRSKDLSRSMRDLFQSTAIPVAVSKEEGSRLNTVSQQGAGLIQVDRAVNYKTLVTPTQLLLNDTANLDSYHTITIRNTGSSAATYQLTHVAAGTAQSIQAGLPFAAEGPVELVDAPARVTIIPSSVTVSPGSYRRVIVRIAPPRGVDESRLPVYSGFIKVASKDETLQVTYLGAAGSLKEKAILDNTEHYFGPGAQLPLVLHPLGFPQANATTYTMEGFDTPSLVYRVTFGSPSLKIDLVHKDADIKPTLNKRGWLSWLWNFGNDVAKLPIVGTLQELDYIPRNSAAPDQENNGFNVFVFDGHFANKTRVDNGEYRILLRALKVTGNPKKQADYESWLSPVVGVNFSS